MSQVRLKRKNEATNSLELFDKTDKKVTLDEETKNFFEEIEKKLLIKRNLGNVLATNVLHQ